MWCALACRGMGCAGCVRAAGCFRNDGRRQSDGRCQDDGTEDAAHAVDRRWFVGAVRIAASMGAMTVTGQRGGAPHGLPTA